MSIYVRQHKTKNKVLFPSAKSRKVGQQTIWKRVHNLYLQSWIKYEENEVLCRFIEFLILYTFHCECEDALRAMQPVLIGMCFAGGPRLLRQLAEIEIRKRVVGADSVAEGYTRKASPSSPHSRRTHTCYPVSRTPSKERPHSLACPHKATSTQPIRHGTYCLFCCRCVA